VYRKNACETRERKTYRAACEMQPVAIGSEAQLAAGLMCEFRNQGYNKFGGQPEPMKPAVAQVEAHDMKSDLRNDMKNDRKGKK
jgi:phosphoribosylamine-glycine ligase